MHYYGLVAGHHKSFAELAVLLTEALRSVLVLLLIDIPSAPALLGKLRAIQEELPEGERRQVTLSEATHLLNETEWRCDRVESDSREQTGRGISVEETHKSLSSAELSDLSSDGTDVSQNRQAENEAD